MMLRRVACVLLCLVEGAAPMRLPRRFGGGQPWQPRRLAAGGAALLLGGVGPRRALALGREASLSAKLGGVPAFYVANARGSPYLLNKEAEGAQECVIFLEPRDAERLLSEMTQASPQLSDARINCVGLDKALTMLKRKPVPSGNVARDGRELVLRYRLSPSARQLGNARGRLGKLFSGKTLPCFVCPDLVIKGKTPVFLALEDLNAAWATAAGGDAAPAPVVDVHNLLDLVVASEQPDALGDFDALLFYPEPHAVAYVRDNRKRGNRQSRLHASIA